MALIAIWMISMETRTVIYRRHFPNNGIKSNEGKIVAMLTVKEESQFVSCLLSALGVDVNRITESSNAEAEESFSFDCTQSNQLPAIGFQFKGYYVWPLIVLEHKGILFCGLPVLKNSSTALIDHIGISVTVSTLQTLINHFSKDNRIHCLEQYFTRNLPFGSQITNPYEADNDFPLSIAPLGSKTRSEPNKLTASTTSLTSNSSNSSRQELTLTVRVAEFISSTNSNENEMIHGTVYISSNIVLPGNPMLTYRIDSLPDLNPILSPSCWLSHSVSFAAFSSASSSSSSSPTNTSSSTPASSAYSSISTKLNSKALRFFHYKCNPPLVTQRFLTYSYIISRKTDSLNYLDLLITVSGEGISKSSTSSSSTAMRFHSFKINFTGIPKDLVIRLTNCNPSQGQLHLDKQNGFYWIVGTKIPKNGQIRLTADVDGSLSIDQLDAAVTFRVDNYVHGFPRPRTDFLTVSDNLYSINFKLTPQLTLATFDYRLKPTFKS